MPDWLKILHSELEALSGLADIIKLRLVYLIVVHFIKLINLGALFKRKHIWKKYRLIKIPLMCLP